MDKLGWWTSDLVANQAPNLAMMYYTGGYSLIAMGGVTAGREYGRMEDEMYDYSKLPDDHPMKDFKYSPLQMHTTALMSGVVEGVSERITLGQVRWMKGALQSGNKSLRTGFVDRFKQLAAPKNILKGTGKAVEEGHSEVWASIGQNYFTYLAELQKPEEFRAEDYDNILKGTTEAFASGFAMSSVMFQAPVVGKKLMEPFQSRDANQKLGENATRTVSYTHLTLPTIYSV